jgi:cobalt/nickel transport system permease protein
LWHALGGPFTFRIVHLADGVLTSPHLLVGLNATGAAALALTLRRRFDRVQSTVYTGTLAAFVLALQMVNVPLVPGASAHVIGAGLLTLTLGPASALLALLAVLTAQALLFADGGITVFAFNALNIAVIPVLAVHAFRRLLGETPRRLALAALLGTFVGNVGGALSLALALVIGAAAPAGVVFSWLVSVQALAGLIEGGLTALAVLHLCNKAPKLIAFQQDAPAVPRAALAWGVVAVALTFVLVPFSSSVPDALERVLAVVATP